MTESTGRHFGTDAPSTDDDEQFGVDMDSDPTVLDALERALKEETTLPPLTLPVKAHPGVQVRYATEIDADVLESWRRRWTNKKTRQVDALRFARTVVINQSEQIIFQGKEPRDSQGNPLTFRSKDIERMTSANDEHMAVQKFFRVDAHIIATCNLIIEASGYGQDAEDLLDPTSDGSML